MDAVSFVIVGVVLFLHAVFALKEDLRNPILVDFIGKDCEVIGHKTGWRNAYISLNPFHPNNICFFRVVLAIVAMYSLIYGNDRFDWIIIYLLAAILDAVDGIIARACNLITEFGEKLDPFCDKLTYLPFMHVFAYQGYFSSIAIVALVIFTITELFGQFVVRYILEKRGISAAANNFGKIKAALAFAIPPYIFVIDHIRSVPDIGSEMMIACTVLSVFSAVTKIYRKKN